MKRLITLIFVLGLLGGTAFAQAQLQKAEAQARTDYPIVTKERAMEIGRALTCGPDRILYPVLKLVGSTINLWTMTSSGFFSAASQMYEVPAGATLTLNGFSFEARYLPSGTSADVVVNAQVYNVSAAKVPVGAALATVPVTIDTSLSTDIFFAVFATPLTITQNFALVVENPTDSAIAVGTNFADNRDGAGEFLAGLRRPVASGGWQNGQNINISATLNFDVDWLMYPDVTYDFDADFVADRTCLVQETPITFTSVSSPILGSRFYNRWVFNNVFNAIPDSTFAWDFGSGNFNAYGSSVMNTYPNGGSNTQKVRIAARNFGYTANGFCTDRDSSDFNSGPVANALFSSDSTAPKTYSFEALPAPFNETWSWDFGDGTTDNSGPTVSHTYATSDTFTVTLTTTSCETDSTISTTFFVVPDFAANVSGDLFQQLSVYPNPAEDLINVDIELNSLETVSITLTDIRGRLVMTQDAGALQSGQVKMNVNSLERGIYLLAIKAGEETTYRKVVLE